MGTKSILQKALEHNGRKTRSYSGRGMYGKSCLAVTTERYEGIGDIFSDVLYYVSEMDESDQRHYDIQELADCFANCAQDSMGLGTVLYFKSTEYVGEGSDEEETKEEE